MESTKYSKSVYFFWNNVQIKSILLDGLSFNLIDGDRAIQFDDKQNTDDNNT